MVPEQMIERHAALRQYVAERSAGVPRSGFWQNISAEFDAELGAEGYRNLGQRNYFPVMADRSLADQFPEAPHVFDPAINEGHMQDFRDATREIPTDLQNVFIDDQVMTLGAAKFIHNSHMLRALHTLFTINHAAGRFLDADSRILEIGAGSGILAGLMAAEFGCKLLIVDLPEMTTVSAALLMTVFPGKHFVLPHEVDDGADLAAADIVIVFPTQIGRAGALQLDLAMNTSSFMEMTRDEVDGYFRIIAAQLRPGGVFYSSNRNKHMSLANYPWDRYARYEGLLREPNGLIAKRPPLGSGDDQVIDDIRRKIAEAP